VTITGARPFIWQAFLGHGFTARELIAAGANPNLLDNQQYDGVTIAAVRDDVPTLEAANRACPDPRLHDLNAVTSRDE
jgi:cytochrome c556